MHSSRKLFLVSTALAVFGMVAAPIATEAQDASQDQPYAQAPAGGDPAARVGRLAVIEGTVSFHSASETQWSPATLNYPVTNGNAFWTEPNATAKIEISSSDVWLNGSTELDVATLDDTSLQAAEPQGEAYLHLKSLAPGETISLQTPRGTVSLAADGRYDLVAGDTDHPTTLTVLDGSAQITGNNISLQVHANETASITGSDSFQGSVGPMTQDSFLASMLQREQPRAASATPAPVVVAQMTGGQDLDQYGSWDSTPEYGSVWYPQVSSDWVPYREGRWSYVAPWGWTWCDNAPWGFAPFHYGRWVQIGPRWGWAPAYPGYGVGYRPVYAPALVSFFGIGVGVGVGIGFGLGYGFGPGSHIGWVPLGPRDAYYPNYRVSRGYLERVNVTNIRNVTNIYNDYGNRRNLPIARYDNSRAATLVAARDMANSRGIAGAYRRPTEAELNTHPVLDRAPIAPNAHTLGLTPRVANELHVQGVQERHAPGPQVSPGAFEHHGSGGSLPPLRGANGEPARGPEPRRDQPGRGEMHPGATGPARPETSPGGLPALRAPGSRPTDMVHPGETAHTGGAAHTGEAGHTGEAARPGEPHPRATPSEGGAPGPRIDHTGPGETRPALRAPDARPDSSPARAPEPRPVQPAETRTQGPHAAVPQHGFTPHEAAPRPQPREEAPRSAAPRPEAPRSETPRSETPRPETPRSEIPRSETPRPEAPRPQPAPRQEAPRPQPAPRPEARPQPQPQHQDQKHPGH